MPKRQYADRALIRLTPEQDELVKDYMVETGLPQTAVIRLAVDHFFKSLHRQQTLLKTVDPAASANTGLPL